MFAVLGCAILPSPSALLLKKVDKSKIHMKKNHFISGLHFFQMDCARLAHPRYLALLIPKCW